MGNDISSPFKTHLRKKHFRLNIWNPITINMCISMDMDYVQSLNASSHSFLTVQSRSDSLNSHFIKSEYSFIMDRLIKTRRSNIYDCTQSITA
jgi:hypothetical protein